MGTKRQNKEKAVYEKAGLPKVTLFPATEFHQPLQTLMHYITAKGQSPTDLHIPLPIGVKKMLYCLPFPIMVQFQPRLMGKPAVGNISQNQNQL